MTDFGRKYLVDSIYIIIFEVQVKGSSYKLKAILETSTKQELQLKVEPI